MTLTQMKQNAMEESLERMIDQNGLQAVLVALANVCGDKAEHLASNWQDTTSAKVWEKRGKRLEDVATTILFSDD